LLVGLKDKYGGSFSKSELRRIIGYKRGGGIYDALEKSGFFVIDGDNISLNEEGKKYFQKVLMPPYQLIKSVGFFLVILGVIILAEWILPTYFNIFIVITSPIPGIIIISIGLFLDFGLLPTIYRLAIRKKR